MTLKKRISGLEQNVPSPASACCLVNLSGWHYIYAFHQQHLDDPEPRPLPPCRRGGGEPCELACKHMAVWLEPPYNGPFEFDESDL